MKVKFVTCIYSNLFGSELGGRLNRENFYRYSLLSLLKMDDADFVCYTSDTELPSLINFFYVENKIDKTKLIFKTYDLWESYFKDKINKYKDVEATKKSDRCVELQYMKFIWCSNEVDGYDFIYWIDAGLSHNGLFSNKFLTEKNKNTVKYLYECSLFNNKMLEQLIKETADNIVVIAKDNMIEYTEATVNPKLYDNFNKDHHIIGGLFGGNADNVICFREMFENAVQTVLDFEHKLYYEEQIMCLIYYNNNECFKPLIFETWYHENSGMTVEFMGNKKPFYTIFEKLNKLNKQ